MKRELHLNFLRAEYLLDHQVYQVFWYVVDNISDFNLKFNQWRNENTPTHQMECFSNLSIYLKKTPPKMPVAGPSCSV